MYGEKKKKGLLSKSHSPSNFYVSNIREMFFSLNPGTRTFHSSFSFGFLFPSQNIVNTLKKMI